MCRVTTSRCSYAIWPSEINLGLLFLLSSFYFFLKLQEEKKINKTYFSPNQQNFKQQLHELLASKYKKMPDVTMTCRVFDKLSDEIYKLLSCSMASNRTPNEIIFGLQSDTEMRNEVVELLISGIDSKTSFDHQRTFINKILSGDDDLRVLLNKQKEKKGFPHNI